MSDNRHFSLKFWSLLNKKERWGFFTLCFRALVNVVMDIFGLGLVFALIATLLIPKKVAQYPVAKYFVSLLKGDNMLPYLALIICIVFIVKTLVANWIKKKEFAYIFALNRRLFQELFQKYLMREYIFHLDRDISEIVKKMLNYPGAMNVSFLSPIVSLFVGVIGLVSMMTFLIVMNPIDFSILFVYIGLGNLILIRLLTSSFTPKEITCQKNATKINRTVMDSLGLIKDVKMAYTSAYFTKQFFELNKMNDELRSHIGCKTFIQRYYLELIVIVGVVLMIVKANIMGSIDVFFVELSVLGVATSRILPLLNSTVTSFANLKLGKVIFEELYEDLKATYKLEPAFETLEKPDFKETISAVNLSYTYPNASSKALDNINIQITKESHIAFVGTSGGGKTSLINMLIGLIKSEQGRVLLDGVPIDEIPNYRLLFGYIPQDITLLDATILENVAFGMDIADIDHKKVQNVLKQAELLAFIESQPKGLEMVVGERGIKLSGGQRQRIGIARALYRDPDILVMDEATAALDNETERKIMKTLSKIKHKTFISIAHRLSTIEKCDVIYVLQNGQIKAQGDYKTLAKESDVFKKMISEDED